MNQIQFEEISAWQKVTFGEATPLSKIAHLAQELEELVADLKSNNPMRRMEYADCFFLLYGSAAADGMTYQDITNAIDEKFAINKARKWGKPDANGVVNHIKEEQPPAPPKYEYKLTFWQKLSLIPIRAMWLLMDKNERKSWHETKKSMEKHECHYTKPFSYKGYKFMQCDHEGCNMCEPVN